MRKLRRFGIAGSMAVSLLVAVGFRHAAFGDAASAPGGSHFHVPTTPYPLGPGAIPFETLSPVERADVEAVDERSALSQPATSYAAFAESGVAAANAGDLM